MIHTPFSPRCERPVCARMRGSEDGEVFLDAAWEERRRVGEEKHAHRHSARWSQKQEEQRSRNSRQKILSRITPKAPRAMLDFDECMHGCRQNFARRLKSEQQSLEKSPHLVRKSNNKRAERTRYARRLKRSDYGNQEEQEDAEDAPCSASVITGRPVRMIAGLPEGDWDVVSASSVSLQETASPAVLHAQSLFQRARRALKKITVFTNGIHLA